jgi:hypothetical protein
MIHHDDGDDGDDDDAPSLQPSFKVWLQWTDGSRTLFQTACSSSMRKNYLLQVNLQWNNTGGMTLGARGKNSCPEFAAMQHWGFRDMGAFQEEKNCFKVGNGIHHLAEE